MDRNNCSFTSPSRSCRTPSFYTSANLVPSPPSFLKKQLSTYISVPYSILLAKHSLSDLNRMKAIHWIGKVVIEQGQKLSTFFQAVSIIDRFLLVSKNQDPKRFGSFTIVSLILASKIEEKRPLSCRNFSMGLDELIERELEVTKALNFKIKSITPDQLLFCAIEHFREIDNESISFIKRTSTSLLVISTYNLKILSILNTKTLVACCIAISLKILLSYRPEESKYIHYLKELPFIMQVNVEEIEKHQDFLREEVVNFTLETQFSNTNDELVKLAV